MGAVTGRAAGLVSAPDGIPTKYVVSAPGSDPVPHEDYILAEATMNSGDTMTLPSELISDNITVTKNITIRGSNGTILTGDVVMEEGGLFNALIMPSPASKGLSVVGTGAGTGIRVGDLVFVGTFMGVEPTHAIHVSGDRPFSAKDCELAGGTVGTFIFSSASSTVNLVSCTAQKSATCTGDAFVLNGEASAKDCRSAATSLSGFAVAGGDVTITECEARNASGAGLKVSGGEVHVHSCDLQGTQYGLQNSAVAEIHAEATSFTGGTTDVYVDSGAAASSLTTAGCTYSSSDIPSSLRTSERFQSVRFSDVEGQRGQHIQANVLSVGSAWRPDEFYCGQGAPYTDGEFVLSNTNLEAGVWADHTTAATSFSDSVFAAFPANTAGACLYIGSTIQKVPAFAMKVPTACTGAGAMVFEGWTGAAWVEMNAFSAEADGELDWVGLYPTEQAGDQNYRVGDYVANEITAPVHEWDRLASVTINGHTGFIYRLRLVTPYTAIGTIEQILCHGHSCKSSQYGREHFGTLIKQTAVQVWSLEGLAPVDGSSVGVFDLPWTSGVAPDNIVFNNNAAFANASRSALGQAFDLPHWVDPSRGMSVYLRWASLTTKTGDVEIQARFAIRGDGEVLTASGLGGPATSVVVAVDGTLNKTYKHTTYGGVFGHSNTDQLGLTLARDASAVSRVLDTLADRIVLISSELYMGKYRD